MEVSVVGRQAGVGGSELLCPVRSQIAWSCGGLKERRTRRVLLLSAGASSRIGFFDPAAATRGRRRVLAIRAAIQSEMIREVQKKATVIEGSPSRRSVVERPQLFVGLPVDAVSDCNALNHGKAIAAGLKALKLLGADGVELPVWWGVVEKEAMGKYNWSGYMELARMVRDAGLQLRVSLYFHGSPADAIPLPQWVSSIGEAEEPDIFFTDRAGKRHKDCLSLAVDDLPVFHGKTPVEVFQDFLRSFRTSFADFLGSTVTDILIGLGPDGELKYPSVLPAKAKNSKSSSSDVGAGEFQCYDKNMLARLKQHAEATGHHYWGLSGPHDASRYDQSPDSTDFFREAGGSWETPYGNFFLSWYSEQLLSHGDRLLSIASSTFSDCPAVALYGKVPVVHSWYKTRSHPSELTAGFYNTAGRDGYKAVAEMFARNSCGMILPCMDLSDEHQRQTLRSSPESLLSQILRACKKHGVEVSGENSSIDGVPNSLEKIKETLSGRKKSSPENNTAVVSKFTYQRMGAYFFSPEHFPLFTQFVRGLDWSLLHPDDLPAKGGEETISLTAESVSGSGSRQMQAV